MTYVGKARIEQSGHTFEGSVDYGSRQERISFATDVWIGGMKSWDGEFVGQGCAPDVGDALLVLEDGRRGRIVITGFSEVDITKMGDEWSYHTLGGVARFVGNGPAPSDDRPVR